MDPSLLLHTDEDGWSPLHHAAYAPTISQAFRIVFESLIRYYPNKREVFVIYFKNALMVRTHSKSLVTGMKGMW